jgi:hypothetical protein
VGGDERPPAFFQERLGELIEHVRHQTALGRRAADGSSERDHLEAAADRGNEAAIKALEGPPVPEEVAYLKRWAVELYGRSGIGMSGLAPLTYSTLESWMRLKGVVLEPYEVEALMAIDMAMMPDMDAKKEPEPAPTHSGAWPDKKE